jgi:molybdate transport system regulatory protein
MMKQELKEVILEKSVDRKLSCASARNIAKTLGLPIKEVGAAADELGIKINNCELGCF